MLDASMQVLDHGAVFAHTKCIGCDASCQPSASLHHYVEHGMLVQPYSSICLGNGTNEFEKTKNNISRNFLSDNNFTNFLCFNFRFIGKNCAAVIVVISVKSKLVMTLDEFGILECVCADVPWLLCNNVQPIMFLTSLTAASKSSIFKIM